MLLEAVARRNHLHPILCGDGSTALRHLASDNFAVILLDLRLPGRVDGFEILRQLAARQSPMLRRIIVVTAVTQARLRSCAEIESVCKVLRKPFELRVLEEHIRACDGAP